MGHDCLGRRDSLSFPTKSGVLGLFVVQLDVVVLSVSGWKLGATLI